MLLVKSQIKKSKIAEKGCFTKQAIKKASVVGILAFKTDAITEKEYDAASKKKTKRIVDTSIRWVGDIFLVNHKGEHKVEDKLNHSEKPNLLYHCGIVFALRNIKSGEELTVDYRYFLSPNEAEPVRDVKTGTVIKGYNAKKSLKESTKELLKLLG